MSGEMFPKKNNHCWFENGFQNHWLLKRRSLLETWFGVCLMRLGKVTPSNGSTTPHRQMSRWWHKKQTLMIAFKKNGSKQCCYENCLSHHWLFQRRHLLAVSVWRGLARSLLQMVLEDPLAKCQSLKMVWSCQRTLLLNNWRNCRFEVVCESLLPMGFCKPVANCQTWNILWWWHQTQCLMKCFPKKSNHCWFENGFQNHWWLKSRSLLETWFGVCLMRLGKVTPSNGSTTPHRQMSRWWHKKQTLMIAFKKNGSKQCCYENCLSHHWLFQRRHLLAVSVWRGLARSLLQMVLEHPVAKNQGLKMVWSCQKTLPLIKCLKALRRIHSPTHRWPAQIRREAASPTHRRR